jgi:type IV pilus assembly protein PilB
MTSDEGRLLEALVGNGLLSSQAAERTARSGNGVGTTLMEDLVQAGELAEDDALQLLELEFQIPYARLGKLFLDPDAVRLVPAETARQLRAMPIARSNGELTVAMADPLDVLACDELRRLTGLRVRRVLAKAADIEKAIAQHQTSTTALEEAMDVVKRHVADTEGRAASDDSELEQISQRAPVVGLVNTLVERAPEQHASDIHVEPGPSSTTARCRIDGVLRDLITVPSEAHRAVVSRLKIPGNMDISERRVPQDGRFSMELEDRPIDFRVSSLPTVLGEKVVMRILDKEKAQVLLDDMGLPPPERQRLADMIAQPHGMFIVTGPTGSGKSTTLYAILHRLASTETNIVTCEEPVEYRLERVNQVQVNGRAGLSFGSFLRSVLRQDPDITMVGEMRDAETVGLAIRAALTGHLVLGTLRTSDAPSVGTRLVDMGIEPCLVASALIGALAQRLVRRVCDQCRERHSPSADELRVLGITDDADMSAYHGRGCRACHDTGYSGREAVFELFAPGLEAGKLICDGSPANVLAHWARSRGMTTVRRAVLTKVRAGETTVAEALRVTAGSAEE